MKKKLINNEQEYREFVFLHLNSYKIDIWEGCDMDKLNKAFDMFDSRPEGKMTEEQLELSRYYFECKDDPKLIELTEIKESLEYIQSNVLEECFGVVIKHDCWDVDEDGNEIDEDGNIIPDDSSSPEALVFEDWVKEFTYPFLIVYWFTSGFDRQGKSSVCVVDFVELKDFKN
jgi:hypothetical protein